jgi:Holliday junction resolvase RusA-like endonuclease
MRLSKIRLTTKPDADNVAKVICDDLKISYHDVTKIV